MNCINGICSIGQSQKSVRNCTHIALPQPTYKTPNDVETSDQSQNFSGDVSGRFPSPAGSAKTLQYTLKTTSFGPPQAPKKLGVF